MNLLAFFLLTAVVFSAALALVGAVALRFVGRRAPAAQARALTGLAVAPVALGLLAAGLCFVPGLVGLVWPALDHCLYHGHGDHPALCALHFEAVGALGWAVLCALTLGLVRPVWRARRTRVGLARLVATAERDDGVLRVESDAAFALATEREILLSSGLLRRLPSDLVPVVVAHEWAHIQRRDTRRLRWVRRALVVWLPGPRRRLLTALELACEQACDEAAAQESGGRLQVARALLAVERLVGAHPLPGLPGFGGSSVVTRVEALLEPPLAARSVRLERGLLLTALAGTLLLTDVLHHALEALVGLLGA